MFTFAGILLFYLLLGVTQNKHLRFENILNVTVTQNAQGSKK